jgi:hypothetical protein
MKRATLFRRSRAADWARLVGGLSLPVLIVAAFGGRVGLVPNDALLPAVALGFGLGVLALALGAYALIDIWQSGSDGAHSAIAGILFASPVLIALILIVVAVVIYPRLTDVTTDTADPPVFAAASALAEPPDARETALQAESYPDLHGHTYPLPLAGVYVAARDLINERGWTLVRESHPGSVPEAAPTQARSEEDEEVTRALAAKGVMTQSRGEAVAPAAEDTEAPADARPPSEAATLVAAAPTPVFGFLDDVVIRLKATPDGTQVDMRSASRIGEHDLGQNARRIKRFLADLDFKLQPDPAAVAAGASPPASAAQ